MAHHLARGAMVRLRRPGVARRHVTLVERHHGRPARGHEVRHQAVQRGVAVVRVGAARAREARRVVARQ
eukprot:scaffold97159_cov75-Phaeocystis_antarctica.AAC.1